MRRPQMCSGAGHIRIVRRKLPAVLHEGPPGGDGSGGQSAGGGGGGGAGYLRFNIGGASTSCPLSSIKVTGLASCGVVKIL